MTTTDADLSSLRFGEAFEALFSAPDGAMRPRPAACTSCAGKLDELKAAYLVSQFPIARVYRIVGAYDKPECLPDSLAPWKSRWDAQSWLTLDEDTGEEILTHPLAVRELDGIDEALLLLSANQRDDRDAIATCRSYFDTDAASLLEPAWSRLLDATTLTFVTGHATTLGALLRDHMSHYASSEEPGVDAPLPTPSERLRCFTEESALAPEGI